MPSVSEIQKLAKEHKTDLILFALSGFSAFIADFTALQIIDAYTHDLLLATAIGIFVGFIVSYVLNHIRFRKRHTEETRAIKQSLPLFVILFVFNTTFTFICLDYNEKHHFLPRIIVKAGTVGFIMVWNYVLFHMYVFRKNNQTTKANKEES